MYLNGFSVRITGGSETTSGYVEMRHGQQYGIVLRNESGCPCDALVQVDGKHIGTFRIAERGGITLERPVGDCGKFTFYERGTAEAERAWLGGVCSEDLGLIAVTFRPGRTRPVPYSITTDTRDVQWTYTGTGTAATQCSTHNRAAGGTGLSGISSQQFYSVDVLDYDHSRQTTIHLRLIAGSSEPRPLMPVMNSTPIPPAVG